MGRGIGIHLLCVKEFSNVFSEFGFIFVTRCVVEYRSGSNPNSGLYTFVAQKKAATDCMCIPC